jgi:hypothetical protein
VVNIEHLLCLDSSNRPFKSLNITIRFKGLK